jgi:hypothetical protein
MALSLRLRGENSVSLWQSSVSLWQFLQLAAPSASRKNCPALGPLV